MKHLLFALMAFFMGTNISQAQQLEPVKWEQSIEKLTDGTFKINLTANVDEGWYIYAQDLEEGGPIPTSIVFNEKEVKIVKETEEIGKLKEGFDEMFEINLRKYADNVVFSTIVKPAKRRIKTTTASVRFMCCDNSRCLPPTTVDFDISLK